MHAEPARQTNRALRLELSLTSSVKRLAGPGSIPFGRHQSESHGMVKRVRSGELERQDFTELQRPSDGGDRRFDLYKPIQPQRVVRVRQTSIQQSKNLQ